MFNVCPDFLIKSAIIIFTPHFRSEIFVTYNNNSKHEQMTSFYGINYLTC